MGEGVPSTLTLVKVGEEASYGAGTLTTVIPVNPPSGSGAYEQILDQGLRGIPARDFGAYQGASRAEVTLEGIAYKAAMSFWTGGMLSSTPASLAVGINDGGIAYVYTGLLVSELTVRYNSAEGFVTYSVNLIGKEMKSTASFATSHDVGEPPVGWATQVVGPGDCAIEGEWTLSREIALLYCGGEQTPQNAYAGPLEVTARATFDFTSSALVTAFLNKTQGAFSTTFRDSKKNTIFAISAPKMDYGEGPLEIDRSGVYVTLAYSMRALYDLANMTGPVSFS